MTKDYYYNSIIEAMAGVGTYKIEFSDAINTLSTILEKRDDIYEQFILSGASPIIEHEDRNGGTVHKKNPCFVLWLDLNTQALAYWRELGLTPSGLKKINEELLKGKKGATIGEVLKRELAKK